MERANYSEDSDGWDLIRWRGAVASAVRGKRGQAFLGELVETLESMPDKKLIAGELETTEGVCAIGAVGVRRGVQLEHLDPNDYDTLSRIFGIAPALVREIEFENDDYWCSDPERRHTRILEWARASIREGAGRE